MKERKEYICSTCGARSTRWLGRCHECGSWNTFEERREREPDSRREHRVSSPRLLSEVNSATERRFSTGFEELDRTLGGGLVPGSVVLLGGEPGVGKSTLLLQVLSRLGEPTLYVSGEESPPQIKGRAERLHLSDSPLYLLCETRVEEVLEHAKRLRPRVVVVDSIQTTVTASLGSASGTVSQIRESAATFIRFAKETETPVILVGHVTKEGTLAGPKVLEHMVDTVLTFEGDPHHPYRVVRATKNRYGPTHEIAFFEMSDEGLSEVLNPSLFLLSERRSDVPGSVVLCAMEGSRPLLLELQALVSPSRYGMPLRVTTGFDRNRVALLLAVLEKRGGVTLQNADVFVNVTGGLELDEPAADLGLLMAIVSSAFGKPLNAGTILLGEVGLGGEVRSVSRLPLRIAEAHRLGFRRLVVPRSQKERLGECGVELVGVATLREALEILF